MKIAVWVLATLALVSACGGTGGYNSGTSASPQSVSDVTRDKIKTCWVSAGIQGDAYVFMKPSPSLRLQAEGQVSEAQADAFNACITA